MTRQPECGNCGESTFAMTVDMYLGWLCQNCRPKIIRQRKEDRDEETTE